MHERVRQMKGMNTKTYHRMHLIVDYLAEHRETRCADIAAHLELNNESTRRLLVRMINENIVTLSGRGCKITYSLA